MAQASHLFIIKHPLNTTKLVRPTIEYIQERFDRYNRQMFGGRLPRIPIRLSDAKTFLGQCVSKIHTHPDGQREHYDFELRISTRLDLPQETVDDTIIHEMIHYFIHYNGLHDISAHGPIFRSIMQSINTVHGRHLTISHKSTPDEHTGITPRRTWHVIAILHLRTTPSRPGGNHTSTSTGSGISATTGSNSGTIGVKVLPRTVEKVIMYHRRVSTAPQVERVDLYLHDDPYFDRYPTSAALRYHLADAADILPRLASARPLTITGTTLTYAK